MTYKEAIDKLKSGELSPYNFYNVDINPSQYYASLHYQTHKNDTIDHPQILKKAFFDIEVFTNHSGITIKEMIDKAECPINAITYYCSSTNTYDLFALPPMKFNLTTDELRDYCLKESRKKYEQEDGSSISYLDEDQDLQVHFYDDPYELTIAFWTKLKKDNPEILSGFNSDGFDIPYMYNYLLHKFNNLDDVSNIMSNYGHVELRDGHDRAGRNRTEIKFIDYILMDQMTLYKPRDDGGMNLGKKLVSYSLKNVSKTELGITKYDYQENQYPNLDTFYEQDAKDFFLYNIFDVALCVKLDQKLGMIDLY